MNKSFLQKRNTQGLGCFSYGGNRSLLVVRGTVAEKVLYVYGVFGPTGIGDRQDPECVLRRGECFRGDRARLRPREDLNGLGFVRVG
jgi:hypothetical protein